MSRPLRTDSDWVAIRKLTDLRDEDWLLLPISFCMVEWAIAPGVFTMGDDAASTYIEVVFISNFLLAWATFCIVGRAVRNPLYAIPLMPVLFLPLVVIYGIVKVCAYAHGEVFGSAGASEPGKEKAR